ncbi:MAG: DUF669 domain-containing protein [Planctomycetota bacterium]
MTKPVEPTKFEDAATSTSLPDSGVFFEQAFEPRSSDLIPKGRYLATIFESEIRAARSRTGDYLELRFVILDSAQVGATVVTRLNLWNWYENVVARAEAEFRAICLALNLRDVKDPKWLHDLPLYIDVDTKPRSDTGALVNVITAYTSRAQAHAERVANGPQPPFKKGRLPWADAS